MKIVGITGGMGSGKSTIARFFEQWGVPIYHADLEARKLSDTDPEIRSAVIQLLGSEAYVNDQMDRGYVASKVFRDEDLLQRLNQIIHPAVGQHFKDWVKIQNAPYCVKEAAILFETGGHKACDWTLLVTAPIAVRIERIMERDGLTQDDILSRLDKQWPDERKLPLADFHIENLDLEQAEIEAKKVHESILKGL